MTIEQKAKAYDEALERARKKHNSKYHPSEGPSGVYLNNADLEEIFPELKESEDEMIRKELLEEIEFIIPHDDETDSEGLILPSYHARIDRYKSYLEKQKESENVSATTMIPSCWTEKQKEQNSAEYIKRNSKEWHALLSEQYRKGYWKGKADAVTGAEIHGTGMILTPDPVIGLV